ATQTVFYQPMPFYTSVKIQVLRHPRLTSYSGLVLVTILRAQMSKFQWGNGASLVRLAATRIMVPVVWDEDGNDVPDWDGMERLGRELTADARAKAAAARPKAVAAPVAPPALTFAPMLITDVFDTMKASRAWYDKAALKPGDQSIYPYVSRTKADNGVEGFCSRQAKNPEPGCAITIGLDTQTVGYQPVPFYTGQNIQVLRHPRLNASSSTVLITVVETQLRKFSWGGNGATLGRLKATGITSWTGTASTSMGAGWQRRWTIAPLRCWGRLCADRLRPRLDQGPGRLPGGPACRVGDRGVRAGVRGPAQRCTCGQARPTR